METLKAAKLPENYLAVMAAAITLAEKREVEVLGIYQYIISEMLRANGIPDVIFPDTAIKNYKQHYETKQREVDQESRKRQRSSEEGRGRETVWVEVSMEDPDKYEYAIMPDGSWKCVGLRETRKAPKLTGMEAPHISPQITPQITPTPTPSQTPATTPSQTPTLTLSPTPATSPERKKGAIAKSTKKVEDPG